MGVWAGAGFVLAETSITVIFHERLELPGIMNVVASRSRPSAAPARAAPGEAPGVRKLLAGLLAIVLVPSALLAAGLVVFGYERAKTQTQEAALATARLLAARVDRRLTELRPGLQALASSPSLQQGNLGAFLQHAQHFVRVNSAAVNVTLVDATGSQILNTARPASARTVPGQPEIAALLRGGDLAVTNLFRGPVGGEQWVAVAVPARVQGRVAYVVGAGIRPRALDDVIEPLPEGWTLVIFDRRGDIVSLRPWREQALGEPAPPSLVAATFKARSGTLETRSKEGAAVLSAFVRAPQSGYTVAIGVPKQVLLAPVRRDAMVAMLVIGGVLVVSWLAAGRLARRIAGSIGYLSHAVRDMRKGHVPGAPRLGFREAEQVRLYLNISAAEMQHLHAEIDRLQDPQRSVDLAAQAIAAASGPMLLVDDRARIVALNEAARRAFSVPSSQAAPTLAEIFIGDEGAYGGAVPGTAVLADGSRCRAVLRCTELSIADADISCVAIDLVPAS
jgi:PAS domain-containing protein